MAWFESSQYFDKKGNLTQDYIPPCESWNHEECSINKLAPKNFELPCIEADFFYKEGFKWGSVYEIQNDIWYEDPANIFIKLLENAWEIVDFEIDSLRYTSWIAEIWNTKLKKGDKIVLEQWSPSEYELSVWQKIYTINTVQNTIKKIN